MLKNLARFHFFLTAFSILIFISSCFPNEEPIQLPPAQTGIQHQSLDMGKEYENQLFINFRTNTVVHTSLYKSWDIGFSCGAKDYQIFLNGGNNVMLAKTHLKFDQITALPVDTFQWLYDSPTWDMDSTAVGNWCNAEGVGASNVYLIKIDEGDIYKLVLISMDDNAYQIGYGTLGATEAQLIEIPKDEAYNLNYFSFADGGKVVQPDAPKDSYDVVFTRYKHIYYYLNNFPYLVTGAMLNSFDTKAALDTVHHFEDITLATLSELDFSKNRNTIGFEWKDYNINLGQYSIRPNVCYVIQTSNGEYYKLRFLSYYDKNGQKGHPSFEFELVK